ncbi:MAG: hypothetical protein IJ202_02435 [Bacteroidales bacterium]|nr:hypothetical protein [Bacteroidales bacterium]
MTEYCIWGTNEPFKTTNAFHTAVRNQAFGKSENNSFYSRNYPSSYFNFSWSGGYLVLNFYNVRTNREEHINTWKKNLSYSLFTELLESKIGYYLSSLNEFPEPPKEETSMSVLWEIVKWIFGALFWVLGMILKCAWAIITLPFKILFS